KEASLLRVSQAQIERDKAHADWERLANMDASLVAPKALDDARYALDGSEEALRVARFDSQKAGLSVATAENQIAELEAKLEETKLQLAEHRILAPFDGIVVRREIAGGETVTGATALFEVVDPARLIAYLSR